MDSCRNYSGKDSHERSRSRSRDTSALDRFATVPNRVSGENRDVGWRGLRCKEFWFRGDPQAFRQRELRAVQSRTASRRLSLAPEPRRPPPPEYPRRESTLRVLPTFGRAVLPRRYGYEGVSLAESAGEFHSDRAGTWSKRRRIPTSRSTLPQRSIFRIGR